MKKSKVLSVVMASALVASVAATAALSVSAVSKSSDIPDHAVGVVGGFNGWSDDIALTDADGDGVYEGLVEVAEVTEEMITGWNVDDVPTGENYLQFKVRLDASWDDSWGAYEPGYDRTWNSQSNVPVKEAVAGQPISFKVFFDIKNPDPAAVEAAKADPDGHYAEEGSDEYMYLHVWYEIVKTEEPSVEESSEEPSVAESSVDAAATETSTETSVASETPATETSTDTTTVPTGDTTSAVALAAVVIASLGTAVVMTKKASSKN